MNCLKFDISAKYGFFKNPENNNYKNFSFEHIHKPALLGILGAILGLDGWNQMKQHDNQLQYYEELKDIRVSIVPHKAKFDTFEEIFNNSTGYANSGDNGGVGVGIRREVLQNPSYTIFVMKDSIKENYYNDLKEMLLKGESKYPIYLGCNTYKAQITNVEEIELIKNNENEDLIISSIYPYSIVEDSCTIIEEDDPYYLKTFSPIDYNSIYHYNYDWFVFTNTFVTVNNINNIYLYKDNVLYFI